MLKTFSRYWAKDIKLYFYSEDIPRNTLPVIENVVYRQMPDWYTTFKEKYSAVPDAVGRDRRRNREKREYDFRRDCLKFGHKVAALTDVASKVGEDLLIMIDADTLAHDTADCEWLYNLFRADTYIAWLHRNRGYPECGFMMFKCWRPEHTRFMSELRTIYESGKIFEEDETHDSYIFQQIVRRAIAEGWMTDPHSLSGDASRYHHPFVRCELAARLDHAKGARKKIGRTSKVEVRNERREPYWR
jgi:hypothetical protein